MEEATTEIEEQDIGLLYPSRSGSCTGSTETIASRLPSRQPSPMEPHVPTHGIGSFQDPSSPLKSPSLSNVQDTHFGLRLAGHLSMTRSRTLPHLAKSDTALHLSSDLAGFEFEQDRASRMSQWVLAFAIVNFDLDVGPVVCGVYPPLYLAPAEKENIAFSSFPDSLQFEQGSEVHSFRVQDLGPSYKHIGLDHANNRPDSIDGYLYGYSHFSQRRDNTSKRGYQQTSLVLLSHLQYPALFTILILKLGPLFLSHGVPMLETACHNIAN